MSSTSFCSIFYYSGGSYDEFCGNVAKFPKYSGGGAYDDVCGNDAKLPKGSGGVAYEEVCGNDAKFPKSSLFSTSCFSIFYSRGGGFEEVYMGFSKFPNSSSLILTVLTSSCEAYDTSASS